VTEERLPEASGVQPRRVRNKTPMPVISIHVPEQYIRAIDRLVSMRRYPSRAEAIRVAIRDFIIEEFGAEGEFRW